MRQARFEFVRDDPLASGIARGDPGVSRSIGDLQHALLARLAPVGYFGRQINLRSHVVLGSRAR